MNNNKINLNIRDVYRNTLSFDHQGLIFIIDKNSQKPITLSMASLTALFTKLQSCKEFVELGPKVFYLEAYYSMKTLNWLGRNTELPELIHGLVEINNQTEFVDYINVIGPNHLPNFNDKWLNPSITPPVDNTPLMDDHITFTRLKVSAWSWKALQYYPKPRIVHYPVMWNRIPYEGKAMRVK